MGKKELLAKIFDGAGLLPLIRRFQRSQIVVINYHRIKPDEGVKGVPFDEGVYGPSQAAFERQIRWLRRDFDVVGESDLLSLVRGRQFKGRFAVITFDDGYRDNYTLAYPVLRANAAPAIFFICPDIIDSRRLGWWDVIAYLVKSTEKTSISVRGTNIAIEGNGRAAIQRLQSLMKLGKASETAGLLDEISQSCGVALPDAQLQSEQFMTWAEVREVSGNGVAIGSHTHTHRVLATLEEAAQRWELEQSKRELEGQLRTPVRTIAYPVGGYDHFSPATMRIAQQCGYEAAFSFHTGANYSGAINPYNMKRIACTDDLDPLFTCGAHLPQVFPWFHRAPPEYVHTPTALSPDGTAAA
jgi:peptidoglycan/xylan/chitin deacetylase (PgdA/CDA1 family)